MNDDSNPIVLLLLGLSTGALIGISITLGKILQVLTELTK